VLAAALAACVALLPGTASAQEVDEMRVCGTAAFDRDEGRCTKDQRSGVRSEAFYCSVRVSGHTGDRFTGRFVYAGKAFPTQSGKVSADGYLWTFVTIGGGTLSGGSWRCEVTAGTERRTTPFTSRGPRAVVANLAACLTRDTVVAGPVRTCERDRSATALPATNEATCSATFARSTGRVARAEILFEGKKTGLVLTRKIPLPVSVLGVQVSQASGLPQGRYACVFSVDGKPLATKRFRIR
jgi:hypothetical protein